MLQRKLTAGMVSATFVILLAWPLQFARAEAAAIRFCFNQWSPYATVRNGEVVGISVEILREAAKQAGLVAVFTELPWNRCLKSVSDGEMDAVLDAAARDNFLQGPTSVTRYSNTFWVREGDDAVSFTLAVLRGRDLGLVDGYVYPPSLLSLIEKAGTGIEYSIDDANNIRKLAFGRVDAIIGDLVGTAVFAREHRFDVRPLHPSHSVDLLYHSFNMGRGHLHGRIDASLAKMLESGEIDRIYMKHVGFTFADIVTKSSTVRQ